MLASVMISSPSLLLPSLNSGLRSLVSSVLPLHLISTHFPLTLPVVTLLLEK